MGVTLSLLWSGTGFSTLWFGSHFLATCIACFPAFLLTPFTAVLLYSNTIPDSYLFSRIFSNCKTRKEYQHAVMSACMILLGNFRRYDTWASSPPLLSSSSVVILVCCTRMHPSEFFTKLFKKKLLINFDILFCCNSNRCPSDQL